MGSVILHIDYIDYEITSYLHLHLHTGIVTQGERKEARRRRGRKKELKIRTELGMAGFLCREPLPTENRSATLC